MENLLSTPNQSGSDVLTRKEILAMVEGDKKGFSFLDFLVILSALFVIAFLGYLYLNPEKEGADTRNVYRSADVSSILTSVSAYSMEKGEIPESIPISRECVSTGHEICKLGPYECAGLVNLSFLNESKETDQMISIPSDPSNKSTNGTGYYISQDGTGSITVCAPYAERNMEILFTRSVF
ncbi:MAG: hypothetical protein AB9915_01715 [Candidatus Dojkabacteria bacterium]